MRRSASSPSMHNASLVQQPSSMMKSSRSSMNLQALPPYVEPPPLVADMWKHVQIHSVLKAPSHVVDMCMMDVYGKPVQLETVLHTHNEKIQSLAYCIATPPEVEGPEPQELEPIIARLRSSRRDGS